MDCSQFGVQPSAGGLDNAEPVLAANDFLRDWSDSGQVAKKTSNSHRLRSHRLELSKKVLKPGTIRKNISAMGEIEVLGIED